MKIFEAIRNLKKKLKIKLRAFTYERFTRYVVDYVPEGKNLRILTNVGDSRLVKNTHANQNKLNRIIVKNKIKIAERITKYEATSTERLIVLMVNIMLLAFAGILVPLTFFIGSYIIFILAIFLFSFLTLTVSVITVDYYILVEEIKNLKNITGYRKDMEFSLPKVKLKFKD